MRVFLAVLVLIFSFQSWTKADDIRDFEIEGMSIGDSLLSYMTKEKINKKKFFNYDSTEMYSLYLTDNLELYDELEINFQSNDKDYKIVAVSGIFNSNINNCLKQKKIIVKDLQSLFDTKPDIYTHIYDNKYLEAGTHLDGDITSESKAYITQWTFKSEDKIRIWCSEWGKDIIELLGWKNQLRVKIQEKKWMYFIGKQ